MKIFFLSLFFSFSLLNLAFAQSFSFIDSNVQYLTPACAGYDDFYVHMRNEKPDSLRMQWKALANPLDSCWQFQYSMCDNYNCYLGIPGTPMTMTKIGTGDTTFLKFSNTALTHYSGNPVVKILVWDMDIPTELDTITYYFTICPDSILCTALTSSIATFLNANSVKIFPVPAFSNINLSYPSLRSAKISITDLSGKEIISIPATGTGSAVNIEWLTEGIYLLHIIENQKISYTQKFIKL